MHTYTCTQTHTYTRILYIHTYTHVHTHNTHTTHTQLQKQVHSTAMLVWGRAADGQLGLGGIEDTLISAPQWNKHIGNQAVRAVACGQSHTMVLLEDGGVLSCGSNNVGQLGQDRATTRPGTYMNMDIS